MVIFSVPSIIIIKQEIGCSSDLGSPFLSLTFRGLFLITFNLVGNFPGDLWELADRDRNDAIFRHS